MRAAVEQGIGAPQIEETAGSRLVSTLISGAKLPFRGLGAARNLLPQISSLIAPQKGQAGRRGSSEDDLPLRVPCSGADAERGLNSTTDERGPARVKTTTLPLVRHFTFVLIRGNDATPAGADL